MSEAPPPPQERDWTRSVTVQCNNRHVSGADVDPSTITSVEDPSVEHPYYTAEKNYSDEDWKAMENALAQSGVLKKIRLEGLTTEAAEALFGGKHWPLLEVLKLKGGKFRLAGLKQILPVLHPLSSLNTLDLSRTGMGVMGARLLKEALDQTRISNLRLMTNNIKDEGLKVILSAQNAMHLSKLDIDGCKFTNPGFETLAQFLCRTDIQLKVLSVDTEQNWDRHTFNRDAALRWRRLLAESISKSSTLEAITLGARYVDADDIQDTLLNLMCDTSNLEALISSNHRLCSLSLDSYGQEYCSFCCASKPALTKAFSINWQVNKGGSIANAIRRKVRNLYLSKDDFDVMHFNEMDVLLMPRLLHLALFAEVGENERRGNWMGHHLDLVPRDDLNGVYRLLRNCHVAELFSVPSPESILRQKDEQIKQLEIANSEQKAEIETMKQRLEQLERDNEELRRSGSGRPNKRAKTGDVESRLAALEADSASRLAALEADVAMLKAR